MTIKEFIDAGGSIGINEHSIYFLNKDSTGMARYLSDEIIEELTKQLNFCKEDGLLNLEKRK